MKVRLIFCVTCRMMRGGSLPKRHNASHGRIKNWIKKRRMICEQPLNVQLTLSAKFKENAFQYDFSYL